MFRPLLFEELRGRMEMLGGERDMANIKSAVKRVRIAAKKTARNNIVKSIVRTSVRRYNEALKGRNAEQAAQALSRVASNVDKAAAKGVIHKNAAARKKSRLARRLAALKETV